MLYSFSLLGDFTETKWDWFPSDASTFAADNDWLFNWISYTCVLFFVPIAAALFWFAYRYRKPKGEKAESDVAHNTIIELTWSIVPSFFLVAMFILGTQSYLAQRDIPDGANEIQVLASKWFWSMDYGKGVLHPELHLLKDEPVKLTMRSSDVIHSLFIPAFRAKKDIVPGRYNTMWFKPTKANEQVSAEELATALKETKDLGEEWNFDERQFTRDGYKFYDLYCAEYCGMDHSEMQTVVVVHETLKDLNAWIEKYSARREGTSPADYGAELYKRRGCKSCHSTNGDKLVGPSFQSLFGRTEPMKEGDAVKVDENYVRESVINPKAKVVAGYQPVMPSDKGQLTDDDIYCIIEWLKTMGTPTESISAEASSEDAESTSK